MCQQTSVMAKCVNSGGAKHIKSKLHFSLPRFEVYPCAKINSSPSAQSSIESTRVFGVVFR